MTAFRCACGEQVDPSNVFAHGDTAAHVRSTGQTGGEPCGPVSMTVTVADRGTGRSYEGVTIRTVTVSALCPACGEVRGAPYSHRFCEDGEWYSVSRWDNACGHVDFYADVLAEARGGRS